MAEEAGYGKLDRWAGKKCLGEQLRDGLDLLFISVATRAGERLFWKNLIGGDRRDKMKIGYSSSRNGAWGCLLSSVFSSWQEVCGNYAFTLAGAADKGRVNLAAQYIL